MMTNPLISSNKLFIAAISSLIGYVFLSDFVYAMLHIGFFKPLTALCTLFFAGLFILFNWRNLQFRPLFIGSIMLMFLYVVFFKNATYLSYFYTPIFAFLLIQRPVLSANAIDKVFIAQFFLLVIEFVTRHHLYTQITTGLFTTYELDFDYEATFDETGFRCKGLFAGVLVATSFVINYALINRNDYKKSFWAFIMAILTNGRLAMLICGVIFLYNFYIKRTHYKEKFNMAYLTALVCIIVIGALIFISTANSTAALNLINAFDLQSTANAGRIARYGLGLDAYSNYSSIEMITGSSYELLDQWNRVVPTESEVLGMLLEIGLVGFIFNISGIINAWYSGNSRIFTARRISYKFSLLMTIVAIIQYRHLLGNLRGLMFWLLLLLIILENKQSKIILQ